jgi:hypothetical protein
MKKRSTMSLRGAFLALMAFLLALVHTGQAQSRFSASVTAAPSLSRVTYRNNDSKPFTQQGFQAGTVLHYHISEQWSVSSGLWLEWTRTPTRPWVVGSGLQSSTGHNFRFPLLLHYQVTARRLAPYLSGGLVLYKEKYEIFKVTYPPDPSAELGFNVNQALRPHLLLGAGLKYRLNEHLSLITQPVFTYGADNFVGTRTFQYSLQTQLACRF